MCEGCSLRSICGGLFDRGEAYDPAELHPVFVSRDAIVEKIIHDPKDPSYRFRSLAQWKDHFDGPPAPSDPEHRTSEIPPELMRDEGPAVGKVTDKSRRLFEAKRRSEGKKAARSGVSLEKTEIVERGLKD